MGNAGKEPCIHVEMDHIGSAKKQSEVRVEGWFARTPRNDLSLTVSDQDIAQRPSASKTTQLCLTQILPPIMQAAVVIVPERSPGPLEPPPSSPTIPKTEQDPLPAHHVSLYAASKAAAERIVLGANSHVLKTTILRPGGIYGAGDGQVVDVIMRGWPYIGHGKSLMSMVWVRDAARAHVHAAHAMLGMLIPVKAEQHVVQRQTPGILSEASPSATSAAYNHSQERLHPDSSPTIGSSVADNTSGSRASISEMRSRGGKRVCRIAGEIFNICNDGVTDPMMYGDMFGGNACPLACKRMGGRYVNVWGQTPTWSVPFWFLDHATAWNEWLAATVGFAPLGKFATQAAIATATAHFPLQVSSARSLLNWEPTPWRQAVLEILHERTLAKAMIGLVPRFKDATDDVRVKLE